MLVYCCVCCVSGCWFSQFSFLSSMWLLITLTHCGSHFNWWESIYRFIHLFVYIAMRCHLFIACNNSFVNVGHSVSHTTRATCYGAFVVVVSISFSLSQQQQKLMRMWRLRVRICRSICRWFRHSAAGKQLHFIFGYSSKFSKLHTSILIFDGAVCIVSETVYCLRMCTMVAFIKNVSGTVYKNRHIHLRKPPTSSPFN